MNENPFTTLDSQVLTHIRTIKVRNHGRPRRVLLGVATWERYTEIGDLRLRITNRPGNHDHYQARLTVGGVSYGKKWYVRKDSLKIKEWLESIKKQVQ